MTYRVLFVLCLFVLSPHIVTQLCMTPIGKEHSVWGTLGGHSFALCCRWLGFPSSLKNVSSHLQRQAHVGIDLVLFEACLHKMGHIC